MAKTAPPLRPQLAFAAFALAAAIGFNLITPQIRAYDPVTYHMIALAVGVACMAIIIFNRSGRIASAGALAATFIAMASIAGEKEATIRSFFGVNYVRLTGKNDARLLLHGSTIHGAYRILDLDGKPMTGKPQPTTYYHDDGAINIALKAARAQAGGKLGNVAVLGLGVGAMACQSAPGEKWSFFEIDREVMKLAQRSELFPFVSTCTPDARIVIGDARLTLQKETVKHDVIILDAFSSDAVPAHLLTREAFGIYLQQLAPDGMIIAHVSNRYMDLRSVAEAAGMAHDLAIASAYIKVDLRETKAQLQLATPTTAVAFSRNPAAINALLRNDVWRKPAADAASTLWTDDYANILGSIARYTQARWTEPPAP
jgi:spermidine synthase